MILHQFDFGFTAFGSYAAIVEKLHNAFCVRAVMVIPFSCNTVVSTGSFDSYRLERTRVYLDLFQFLDLERRRSQLTPPCTRWGMLVIGSPLFADRKRENQ